MRPEKPRAGTGSPSLGGACNGRTPAKSLALEPFTAVPAPALRAVTPGVIGSYSWNTGGPSALIAVKERTP